MIYHMAHASDWQAAHEDQSAYRGSADDLRDGFIHFSTAEQIRVSAAKHRDGQRDLLLIAVDPAKLGDALVWEESRDGALFPHLYSHLDPSIAEAAIALPWDDTLKAHVFPQWMEA